MPTPALLSPTSCWRLWQSAAVKRGLFKFQLIEKRCQQKRIDMCIKCRLMIEAERDEVQEKYKYSNETMDLIVDFTAKRLMDKISRGEMNTEGLTTYERFQIYNQEMKMIAESLNQA